MSCDLQSDSTFTFPARAVCLLRPCRFSAALVYVLSSVKDISCSASHCAGREKSTSRWSLLYPQERYLFPSSPCRAIYSSSLMADSHVGFSCTLYEFGPCLRTHQECYLPLFEMLVAVVGAGDRVEFLRHCSRQKRDLISPLQTASLTPGRRTQIPFLLTISAETEEPKILRYEWEKDGVRGAEMSCLFTDPVASERTVI